MKRRSYYPHNQQIVSTVTATSSTGLAGSRPGTPANANGTDSLPHGIPAIRERDPETYSTGFAPPIPNTKMVPMEKHEATAICKHITH